jgi:hypothetical protein
MKTHKLTKYLFVLAFVILTGVFVKIAVSQSQQQGEQQKRDTPEEYEQRMAFIEVLRREGLKGAARIKGDYVGKLDPHPDWLTFDLEMLTQKSVAVVVGIPVDNRCILTPDGQSITTDYDVVVQEVLKGDIQVGSTIKVALPGGKVKFLDGTTAEVKTPGVEGMVHGWKYALYLSEYRVKPGVYDLTAGPQGMIELPDDGKMVISQARETDPVKKQVKDKDAKTFLKEARKLARKWPLPGKCCS